MQVNVTMWGNLRRFVPKGAASMVLMSESRARAERREPLARIVAMSWAGVDPAVMGIAPVPATKKVLDTTGLTIDDFDVIEMNEAFASQGLACMRQLGLADDAEHVNPNGGAIALGHPVGMSGARIALTAAHQLARIGGRPELSERARRLGKRSRSKDILDFTLSSGVRLISKPSALNVPYIGPPVDRTSTCS